MAVVRKKGAPSRGTAPKGRTAPSRTRSGKKKSNVITVDFTDVEAGGGMPTPDGVYVATVSSAERDVSQSSGNEMIVVRWKTNIGSTVFDRFVLVPQSLWVLRTALQCLGIETPDGEFSFDPDDLVGQTCGIEITNEEYEEKDQPRVTGYMTEDAAQAVVEAAGGKKKKPAKKKPVEDDDEEEEDEDDAPPPRRRGKAKPKDEEEDDEEEEEEEEEEDDDDSDSDDDDEEEEDDDEEEDEPPAKKKPQPKKKGATKPAAASKKVKSTALRPGASVSFEDEEGNSIEGVIQSVDGKKATVVDDEETEWEMPLSDLTKI